MPYTTTVDINTKLDTSLEPKESTVDDYFEALNPFYASLKNPETRSTFESLDGSGVDVESPEFKAIYDDSTDDVKNILLGSETMDEAYKIYAKNKRREEALNTINEDNMAEMLLYGAPAALLSPTSLIPASPIFKALKVKEAVSLADDAVRTAVASGVYAGTLGATDEMLFEAQGTSGDPVGAFGYGLAFGGVLGAGTKALSSVFSGKDGVRNATLANSKSDTLTADLERDPDIIIDTTDGAPKVKIKEVSTIQNKEKKRGRPKKVKPIDAIVNQAYGSTSIERLDKSLMDFGPMKWLNSDIIKLYQHKSPILRTIASKLAKATISIKDATGKYIKWEQDAWSYKRALGGIANRKNEILREAFKEARTQYGYKGNMESFVDDVSNVYMEAANKQNLDFYKTLQEELAKYERNIEELKMEHLNKELEKAKFTGDREADMAIENDILNRVEYNVARERTKLKQKVYDEFFGKDNIEERFKHPNKAITKAALAYKHFFEEYLENGKKLGMKKFEKLNPNRIYAPRIVDFDKIDLEKGALADLTKRVEEGLRRNPMNSRLTDEQIKALVQNYVDGIMSTKYKQSFTHDNYIAPPAQGRVERLKYEFDTEPLQQYFKSNLEDLSRAYHHQMAGRQALTRVFGDDIAKDIPKFMDEVKHILISKEGEIDTEAIGQLENVINDIGGTLRLNPHNGELAWQLTHTLSSFQTARLGGAFGVLQGVEAFTSAVFSGIGPIIRSGRIGKALKEAVRVMYKDGKVKDSFARFVKDMGFYSDVLEPHHINRYSESGMEIGANPTKGFNFIHGALQKFNDLQFKYNGLKVIKAFTEDVLAAGITQQLREIGRLSRNLPDAELRRLSHMGLDEEMAKELGRALNKVNGDITKLPHTHLDRLQHAIINGIEETLVQGDSIYIPTWAKVPSIAKELVLQFMRFPLIAHNIYLRKGYTEEQARMFASVATSVVVYGAYRYLREQAAIALGATNPKDAKYDIFDNDKGDDNLKRAIIIGLSYSPNLGMFTSAGMGTAKMLGVTFPANDYRSRDALGDMLGPSYSSAKDVIDLMRKIVDEDYITDERALIKAKGLLTPSIPVINELTNEYIKRNY